MRSVSFNFSITESLSRSISQLWVCLFLVFVFLPWLHSQETNTPPLVSLVGPDKSEQVQMDVARGFLARDFYDLALAEYRKYLEWFPTGIFVEEAKYHIAECFRGLGKLETAREQYLAAQISFPKGAFFARASFRLGEMEWNQSHYLEALPKFSEAAEKAEGSETRLVARFYQARTLVQLGKSSEAIPMLQELGQTEKQNPYRGFALFELAKLAEAQGQQEEAHILFAKIWDTDSSPVLRAEAGIKAGVLEMKVKDWAGAASHFEKVRRLDVSPEWIEFANANLVRAYYQNDQYASVLRIFTDWKNKFPKEAQVEMDLLYAHTLRLLKKYKEAIQRYDFFLKNYPDHPSNENAAYERLICLYALESASWDAESAVFLKTYPQAKGGSQILYLQADRAFRRKDYVAAAAIYGSIPLIGDRRIDPALAPEIIYRHGLSLAQTGRHPEAIKVYSDFIQHFPNHSYVSNALFQRGLSDQLIGKSEAALASFWEIVARFPKSPEREAALYRSALLRGELKLYAEMRDAFQQLAKEYPKNSFTDDAMYWIGWSFFEEKRFEEALPYLEKARKANSTEYGPQSTSRIILALYRLKRRQPLLKEVEELTSDALLLSPEIYGWLAEQSAQDGDQVAAERQFRKLLAHPDASSWKQSARWGLAKSLAAQSKWKPAIEIWEAYQKDYPDPVEIIATKLRLVRAYTATKAFDLAQKNAEDVLRLQPEGKNNAEARYLLGELMAVQQKYMEAGKYYLSVAVLYEDPEVTPRALSRAIQSFQSAGETNQVLKLQQELKTKYPKHPER